MRANQRGFLSFGKRSQSVFIHNDDMGGMPTHLKSHIFFLSPAHSPDALSWRRLSSQRSCSSRQLPVQSVVHHTNSWELEMTPASQLLEGRRRGGVWLCMWAMWLTGHEAGIVFNPGDKWTHRSSLCVVITVQHFCSNLSSKPTWGDLTHSHI